MSISRLVFFMISITIISGAYLQHGIEMAIAVAISILFSASMVWFNTFWANYLLPWGFMEYFSSDFKSPGNSAPAIVFLGWVILLILGLVVFII